ncbi:MAG TPA: fluoride efflux transporter CrcB [Luteimicrobium sp.]|jgi:CrcB protein|nr:fluoride efflux transporter CrcB [Luteimicrobium sp.]
MPDGRRAHHLDPVLLLVVAVGGGLGTCARYALSQALLPEHGLPVGTLTANVVGAFLLGVLLELLVRAGRETRGRRVLRLGLGTGFMGGFTTFSSLALEVERLLQDGRVGLGLAYGLGSVVVGFAACLLGVLLSARHHRRLAVLLPRDPDAPELGL